jgi:hypothetical protein
MIQNRRMLLDLRSVIIAVGVFVVGTALGFGVGYRYEQHENAAKESSENAAKESSAAATNSDGQDSKEASAAFAEQTRVVLVACMAKEGVRYPSADADLSKPPPGVAEAAFQKARDACAGGILGVKP